MRLVTIQVWFDLHAHPRISEGKLAAIRAWHKATGCGLKEAKDFVEDCDAIGRAVSVQLTAEQLGMFVALIGQTHHDEGLGGLEQFMGIKPLTARVLEQDGFEAYLWGAAGIDFTGVGA
jgi:hypothetical protein